jgi:hypothetical protein
MANRHEAGKRSKPKTILRLPDLEQSKHAVLNSLAAANSQESYGHAIDDFIGWYCSKPRLAFNRTVVLRYRGALRSSLHASKTRRDRHHQRVMPADPSRSRTLAGCPAVIRAACNPKKRWERRAEEASYRGRVRGVS